MFVAQAAIDSGARLPGVNAGAGARDPAAGARVDDPARTAGPGPVKPGTGRAHLDGELLAAPAAASVPLSRLYFL